MRILVLGGDGMLGHVLVKSLRVRHEVHATFRRSESVCDGCLYYGVDARTDVLERVILDACPDVVINAVGIVKQRSESKDVRACIEINALMPYRLLTVCQQARARIVHLSTDCVFSGLRGNYAENDLPDPLDVYGRSKLLGEIDAPGTITLRTSMIGLELFSARGLIEWFLAQRGVARGFRRAIFSGFSTHELSRVIDRMIVDHPAAHGVFHVSSAPIDKHTLLTKLRDRLRLPIEIVADDSVVCDRSLNSSRFRSAFSYDPPSWDVMIEEIACEIEARAR